MALLSASQHCINSHLPASFTPLLSNKCVTGNLPQGSESMGSEGDDDESVDLDDGSGDAMAEGGGAADIDADSSGAEDMEDVAGDEARAGAAVASGVLAMASDQNVQPVVALPQNSGAHVVGQANCGGDGNPAANRANGASGGTLLF